MAQRVYLESIKPGLTATDRRLFYSAISGGTFSGDSPTADPSLSSDGFVTQGVETLHIFFEFTPTVPGADSVDIQLWWWSSITGKWHAGEAPINSITENTVFTVESLGLERLYIQVKNAVGTSTMSSWASRVIPT